MKRLPFIFATLLIPLQSCKTELATKLATSRLYAVNKIGKQDVPFEMKMAMMEGCTTAIWARGNQFYRSFATYRQNPDLMKNETYKFVWHRTYNICFQMVNIDTFAMFGSKLVSNRLSGLFDIREAKEWTGLSIGGNPDYAPSLMLDESTSKGIPGSSDANKTGNFFGFWGTCQFC